MMNDKAISAGRDLITSGSSILNDREAILLRLTIAVSRMIEDWDRDNVAPLTEDTLLVADLGFQSLDIVVLTGDISRQLNRRDIPFERLLLMNGQPVSDLSLGVLADFLWEQVRNTR